MSCRYLGKIAYNEACGGGKVNCFITQVKEAFCEWEGLGQRKFTV